MTFIASKDDSVHLRVLQENDEEAHIWTRFVMHSQKHMEFVMTGSTPVRWFDVRDEWKREREKGAILFGIWRTPFGVDGRAAHHNYRFIGTCGLYQPYEVYRSYESRFMIVDPDAIGKGIGLEVAKLLNEYAFKKLNVHRIGLGVSAINLRAIKTYLDAGYKFEGTFKDSIYTNGKYYDTYRMAITRSDWERWTEDHEGMQEMRKEKSL